MTTKVLPPDWGAMGEAAKLFTRSLMMGLDSAVRKNEFAELSAEDVENLPYAEAVEYLKKRDVIKKVDYNKLSDKMRFRAFTASRIADGDLLKRINSELIKNVNDGKGLKDFLSLTKTDILNKVGMGAGGQGWYWETVYRTNVQTAYNTGRMMGFEEDKPLALHFVGIEDARQTDVCHSLSNVIRPYDDPLWEKYIPPLHFGCRSTVRAIYDEDELPEEWSSLEGIEKPAKGFGTNPLENDSWWNELSSQVARAKEYGVQGEIEAAKIALGVAEVEESWKTGRSVGAMAKRFYVDEENPVKVDEISDWIIKENTDVLGVKVIAKGIEIRDVQRLIKQYPLQNGKLTSAKDWYKVRGTATLFNTQTKAEMKAEIHWYQCKDIGKVEFKLKREFK